MKNEKKPIKVMMYLKFLIDFISDFFIKSLSANKIKIMPSENRMKPCPMSPYITPNKKGKVTA